ncbi:hypothetical protein GGG16DRAFT_114106 [Schizophyllum commune]
MNPSQDAGQKRPRNKLSIMVQLASAVKRSSSSPASPTSGVKAFTSPSSTPCATPRTATHPSEAGPASSNPSLNPSPTGMQSSPLTRPPTLNELDGAEKSRLLKKARKLSKVFGEVAVLRDVDDSSMPPPPPLPKGPGSSPSTPMRPSFNISRADVEKSLPDPPRPSIADSAMSISSFTHETSAIAEINVEPPSEEASRESMDLDIESPPPKHSEDQLRRIRMAKLSRHFGENIPLEILTDASASSRRPSTPDGGPRRKRLKRIGRQASVDGLYSAVVGARPKLSTKRSTPYLRRSRSLWGQKQSMDVPRPLAHGGVELVSEDFQARYEENFGSDNRPPLPDGRRAMDVRRAKKMRELFGQDPPPQLIRISDDKENQLDVPDMTTEERRASLATLLSLSTLSATDLPRSGSAMSQRSDGKDLPPRPRTAPSRGGSPELPSFATIRERDLAFAALYPRNVKSFDETVRSIRASIDSQEDPVTFQERRRRAAKLSRFFGVGYQDLTPTLISMPSPTSSSPSSPISAAPPLVNQPETHPAHPTANVDVRVTGRARFWNFSNHETKSKSTNVHDVLDKLRKL